MDIDEARCFLCFLPVMPDQLYLVVYRGNLEKPSIAATENRAGVLHLVHLENIFRPDMIAVSVHNNPFGGHNNQRVEVQVAL